MKIFVEKKKVIRFLSQCYFCPLLQFSCKFVLCEEQKQ